MKSKKLVHEDYHNKSKSHHKIMGKWNLTYYPLIKVIDNHVKPSDSILDIGCGSGSLSFYYANKNHKIHGIDISNKAISNCNWTKKLLKLNKIKFEVIEFPKKLPKDKSDFIILTEVIEHIPNDILAIKKIHKILNSNGKLFLTTPSDQAPLHRLGLTKKFDKRVGHERRYSKEELINLLTSNGFKILKVYTHESIVRNFFYVFPSAGFIIKFIKGPLVPIFTYFDNILVSLFGESNFMILAQKK